MSQIAELILSWFTINARDFPFRWQKDPYRVLVAGILLRQTPAIRVAPVYSMLIDEYPTQQELAKANEQDLIRIIKSLGIPSRARSLIEIAKAINSDHGGIIPSDYNALIDLPSVGDYIASCILTLGYGQSLPMVDVNVKRIFNRLYEGAAIDIHKLYQTLCPKGKDEVFHYAILDFAYITCKPLKPKCHACPLIPHCSYYRSKNLKSGNSC